MTTLHHPSNAQPRPRGTPDERMRALLDLAVLPTLRLMSRPYDSARAAAMLAAIAETESRCWYRDQVEPNDHNGPALSVYQIERPTAAWLCTVPAVQEHLERVNLWPAMRESTWLVEWSDVGATILARHLLYLRTGALPRLAHGDVDAALDAYLRAWRPGKPAPERFREAWPRACDLVATLY